MGLPITRDETLTGASKVRSALLNRIQDCIVSGRRPAWKRSVGTVFGGGSGWAPAALFGWNSTGAGTGLFHVPADIDDRIIGCELVVGGDTAHNVTYTLQVSGVVGLVAVSTPIGSITEAPSPTNIRTIALTAFIPTILAAGQWFQLSAAVNGAGISLLNVIPEFDRL